MLSRAHVCGGTCWADAGAGAGFEGGEVAGLAEAGGVGPGGDGGVSVASIEIDTPARCAQKYGLPNTEGVEKSVDTNCWFDTAAAPRGGGTQADCAWMRTGHD